MLVDEAAAAEGRKIRQALQHRVQVARVPEVPEAAADGWSGSWLPCEVDRGELDGRRSHLQLRGPADEVSGERAWGGKRKGVGC